MNDRPRLPRVALIVPSSNTVMEMDLHHGLRGQCSVHTARMYLVETTRDAEIAMIEEHAPKAAADLGTLRPDLLVFGCTSAGSLFGPEYDAEVCGRLATMAKAPALGVLGAVAEELDKTEGRRLAVITPYVEDLTLSVARAAASERRQLAAACGMGISDNVMLAEPTPGDIVEFCRKSLVGKVFDVLFVSCTNFRALEAKPMLEAAFSVPVITSNSAVLSAIIRRCTDPGRPRQED